MIFGNNKVSLPEPAVSHVTTYQVSKAIELLREYPWQCDRADASTITVGFWSPNILLREAQCRAQRVISDCIAKEGDADGDSVQAALPVVLWLFVGFGCARERFNDDADATGSLSTFSEPLYVLRFGRKAGVICFRWTRKSRFGKSDPSAKGPRSPIFEVS